MQNGRTLESDSIFSSHQNHSPHKKINYLQTIRCLFYYSLFLNHNQIAQHIHHRHLAYFRQFLPVKLWSAETYSPYLKQFVSTLYCTWISKQHSFLIGERKVLVIEGDDSPAQELKKPHYGTVQVQHFETLMAPYYATA